MYGGSILPGNFRGKDVTVVDVFEAVGRHAARHHVRRGTARAGMRGLPLRRCLRRAVHRQHHGHRQRGDRAGAARLGRRAGALRGPRPLGGGERPGGDGAAGEPGCAARHLHGGRRSSTPPWWWRRPAAAPMRGCICPAMAHEAGIRFTMDDVVEIIPPHAIHRRPEAGRQIRGVRRAQDRRHPGDPEGAAGRRPAEWRLHHRDRAARWRRT